MEITNSDENSHKSGLIILQKRLSSKNVRPVNPKARLSLSLTVDNSSPDQKLFTELDMNNDNLISKLEWVQGLLEMSDVMDISETEALRLFDKMVFNCIVTNLFIIFHKLTACTI